MFTQVERKRYKSKIFCSQKRKQEYVGMSGLFISFVQRFKIIMNFTNHGGSHTGVAKQWNGMAVGHVSEYAQ